MCLIMHLVTPSISKLMVVILQYTAILDSIKVYYKHDEGPWWDLYKSKKEGIDNIIPSDLYYIYRPSTRLSCAFSCSINRKFCIGLTHKNKTCSMLIDGTDLETSVDDLYLPTVPVSEDMVVTIEEDFAEMAMSTAPTLVTTDATTPQVGGGGGGIVPIPPVITTLKPSVEDITTARTIQV